MHLDERIEGDYKIYTGALEAPLGDGYIAALVIRHVNDDADASRETYRDDSLACGHRWASPRDALSYALNTARRIIRTSLQPG